MNKLELVKTNLASHIGEEKIKKIYQNRYLVDCGIILYDNFNSLPINLVEIDNKVYFADYGQTLEGLECDFESISEAKQEKITSLLKDNDIEFDGKSLIKETNAQNAFLDYNKFVKTIILIESIIER